MKRHQTGEAMLAVMVVLLAVMWLGSGHMGMMGGMMRHDDHTEKPAETDQPTKTESSLPAPQASPEHQH